jgi:hypothetical protein
LRDREGGRLRPLAARRTAILYAGLVNIGEYYAKKMNIYLVLPGLPIIYWTG